MTRCHIARRDLRRASLIVLALAGLAACGKKGAESDTTTAQTSSGAIAPAAGVQVADVNLGRSLGTDKQVTSTTTTFSPRDTIYASVHTTGTAQNTNVTARWTYQDGQVVNERSETISPTGDAYTEFHIAKPSGWPAGKYTLHVLVNGQEVQSKDFTVQQ